MKILFPLYLLILLFSFSCRQFYQKTSEHKNTTQIIAHRGFSGAAPENTLVAFQKAKGDKTKAVKIVVLGSSTAARSGPSESHNSWVNRYRRKLQSINGYHQVINIAVGGFTSYQVLPTGTIVPQGKPIPNEQHNVTKALSFNPDAVLINLPSNDANLGFTVREQLDNYKLICQPLFDHGIPVWISTPQGRNMSEVKRKVQLELRDSIYVRYGRKVLDFWSDLAQWSGKIVPKYDSGDGIYLNDEAHSVMFQEVWEKDVLGFIHDKRKEIVRKDTAYTTPLYRDGYLLRWHDEFDGTTLDTNIWTHELGDGCPDLCGWGNREKVWYRPDNSQVINGKLIITSKPDKVHDGFWSASRIITDKKVDFQFGRIDVCAKLPETRGLWPAIWLLGVNRDTVGWPYCGEIDIMEEVGHIPHRVRGTIIYKGEDGQVKYIGDKYELKYNNFSDDFHVFSIDWNKERINYYVDDQLYINRKYSDLDLNGIENPFLKPFYMIINCAVGGNLPGNPDHTSIFPQTFEVDYVRYYRSNNHADLIKKYNTYENEPSLKLMTYNMRLDIESDGVNAWANRRDQFVEQIKISDPDIIGTQEGLSNQIEFIDNKLEKYNYIGIGRNRRKGEGEYCAIFYKKENIKLIESNTFWLSNTPEKSSRGWDAAYKRICTYGLFEENKSGQLFWVFNTHLDNEGKVARREAIKLILDRINQVNTNNYAVVFMGDLNVEPDDRIIHHTLSIDYLDAAAINKRADSIDLQGTFNDFKLDEPATDRIDYIFLSKNDFYLRSYRVIIEIKNGIFPSDHFPIIVETSFN